MPRKKGVFSLRELIELQKKIVPDVLEVMQTKFSILSTIDSLQPIGRRGLAESTNLTERTVRSEVEFLQNKGFIEVTSKGMYLSKEGKVILEQLSKFMREIMGLNVLEDRIKDKLNVAAVTIVPGNSDEDDWVKQEMGKACMAYLNNHITKSCTFAVTGGTTIAALAEVMTPFISEGDFKFVPARGGVGEKVENQANSIVAEMARQTRGTYRLLYIPDHLSESAYQSIINEPSINEALQQIKGAEVVLHGIGDALSMAERRRTPEHIINKLKENHAAAEAFGYYFNDRGEVVHKVRTVGLQLEDLPTMKHVITLAGGKSKGQAITAYFKKNQSDLLITDEAAAEEILRDSSL